MTMLVSYKTQRKYDKVSFVQDTNSGKPLCKIIKERQVLLCKVRDRISAKQSYWVTFIGASVEGRQKVLLVEGKQTLNGKSVMFWSRKRDVRPKLLELLGKWTATKNRNSHCVASDRRRILKITRVDKEKRNTKLEGILTLNYSAQIYIFFWKE